MGTTGAGGGGSAAAAACCGCIGCIGAWPHAACGCPNPPTGAAPYPVLRGRPAVRAPRSGGAAPYCAGGVPDTQVARRTTEAPPARCPRALGGAAGAPTPRDRTTPTRQLSPSAGRGRDVDALGGPGIIGALYPLEGGGGAAVDAGRRARGRRTRRPFREPPPGTPTPPTPPRRTRTAPAPSCTRVVGALRRRGRQRGCAGVGRGRLGLGLRPSARATAVRATAVRAGVVAPRVPGGLGRRRRRGRASARRGAAARARRRARGRRARGRRARRPPPGRCSRASGAAAHDAIAERRHRLSSVRDHASR